MLRMQTTWLTLVAGLTLVIVLAMSPAFAALNAHYSGSLTELAATLGYPSRTDVFNGFRASLVADMLFLIAYGFLLRTTARISGTGWAAMWAARLTIPLMAADVVENATTLHLLRRLEDNVATSSWFTLMNWATFSKWFFAAAVCAMLASLWWKRRAGLLDGARLLATLGAFSFGVGALASLVAALSFFTPSWRHAGNVATQVSQLPWAVGLAVALAVLAPGVALVIQLLALGVPGLLLRFLVLARVPFGALLFVAAFGPIAFGPQRALLGGILQVQGFGLLLQVATYAVLVALACGTQINLVRAYAEMRFDDRGLHCLRHRVVRDLVFWTALLCGASLPLCALAATPGALTLANAAGVAVGILGALAAVAAAELAAAYCGDPTRSRDLPQFVIPAMGIPWLTRLLLRARHAKRRMTGWFAWLPGYGKLRMIRGWLYGPGYVDPRSPGAHLLPGHTLAIFLATITLLLYGYTVYTKLMDGAYDEGGTSVPTLTAILLLVLLVSWALSALTFFLDRYRVPLLVGALAVALALGGRTYTDHVFKVDNGAFTAPPQTALYSERTPGEVLATFKNPVLISAAGGGIQAGAWAAEVIRGLDAEDMLNDTLRDRVALMSSVSGGSMGALYFGAFHQYPGSTPDAALRESVRSSLDDVATALAGLDVWRVIGIFGWLPPAQRTSDRGLALEDSWRARLPVGVEIRLSEWAKLAGTTNSKSGRPFPAFLFNTTVVETGQPLAIATTAMPSAPFAEALKHDLSNRPLVQSFNSLYGLYENGQARDVGIEIPTAARLSAAFPYVSPAAAPNWADPQQPNYHLVDGGYYDNYGLFGLAQWVDDALSELEVKRQLPPAITVVVIRGEMDPASTDVPRWGWFKQLPAPALAFLGTRSYGQWAGGSSAIKLLREKWAGKVAINDVAFPYPVEVLQNQPEHRACADPPLSWILTEAQKQCLRDGWNVSTAPRDRFKALMAATSKASGE